MKAKYIGIFMMGAMVGGFISYIIASEKVEKEMTSIMEEERKILLDEMPRALRKNKIEEADEVHNDPFIIAQQYGKLAKPYSPSEMVELRSAQTGEVLKRPFGSMSPLDDDEEEDEAPIDKYEIFIISEEEFYEHKEHYDKINLTYYGQDDVLCDENEEVITDIDSVIGEVALNRFGDQSNDANTVYIRNDNLSSDYEVIRIDQSYEELVVGSRPVRTKRRGDDDE